MPLSQEDLLAQLRAMTDDEKMEASVGNSFLEMCEGNVETAAALYRELHAEPEPTPQTRSGSSTSAASSPRRRTTAVSIRSSDASTSSRNTSEPTAGVVLNPRNRSLANAAQHIVTENAEKRQSYFDLGMDSMTLEDTFVPPELDARVTAGTNSSSVEPGIISHSRNRSLAGSSSNNNNNNMNNSQQQYSNNSFQSSYSSATPTPGDELAFALQSSLNSFHNSATNNNDNSFRDSDTNYASKQRISDISTFSNSSETQTAAATARMSTSSSEQQHGKTRRMIPAAAPGAVSVVEHDHHLHHQNDLSQRGSINTMDSSRNRASRPLVPTSIDISTSDPLHTSAPSSSGKGVRRSAPANVPGVVQFTKEEEEKQNNDQHNSRPLGTGITDKDLKARAKMTRASVPGAVNVMDSATSSSALLSEPNQQQQEPTHQHQFSEMASSDISSMKKLKHRTTPASRPGAVSVSGGNEQDAAQSKLGKPGLKSSTNTNKSSTPGAVHMDGKASEQHSKLGGKKTDRQTSTATTTTTTTTDGSNSNHNSGSIPGMIQVDKSADLKLNKKRGSKHRSNSKTASPGAVAVTSGDSAATAKEKKGLSSSRSSNPKDAPLVEHVTNDPISDPTMVKGEPEIEVMNAPVQPLPTNALVVPAPTSPAPTSPAPPRAPPRQAPKSSNPLPVQPPIPNARRAARAEQQQQRKGVFGGLFRSKKK